MHRLRDTAQRYRVHDALDGKNLVPAAYDHWCSTSPVLVIVSYIALQASKIATAKKVQIFLVCSRASMLYIAVGGRHRANSSQE